MALTKIEASLFGGNQAHFVKAFESAGNRISMTLTPVEPNARGDVTAPFVDVVMLSVWNDPEELPEWPLDIIGFDCYQSGDRWKFVLNCVVMEWIWESKWPEVSLVRERKENR